MGFDRYFHDGTVPRHGRPGFLRVRVSDDVQPTGYVAVYLESGTQLLVHTREVLDLDVVANADIPSPRASRGDR